MSLGAEDPQRARRRVVYLLFVAGAVAVLLFASHSRPVDVSIRYNFEGLSREEVSALRATWTDEEGEEIEASWNYAGGAPQTQRHTLSLLPGEYDVVVIIERRDDTFSLVESSLQVEEETTVQLDLVHP